MIVTGQGNLPWRELKLFDGDAGRTGNRNHRTGCEESWAASTARASGGRGCRTGDRLAARDAKASLESSRFADLLCEGGPTLYGSLARADLIDEKFVTVSPVETGQLVPAEQERLPSETVERLLRPTTFGGPGFTKQTATWWRWMSCRKIGDHEFNRYRRRRRSTRSSPSDASSFVTLES